MLRILVADDDSRLRTLVATLAAETAEGLSVLEAGSGAEAIQIARQEHPQIALLDVNMPRLGGIEAAATLRELRPEMRLALYTANPERHRERARDFGLPLFGKLPLDDAIRWLTQAAGTVAGDLTPRQLAAARR